MIDIITESSLGLVNSWKQKFECGGEIIEIKVDEDTKRFSGDIISKACFGSSYAQGAKASDLSPKALDQFIVDNCRNIYLAGFETSAVAASWCLMLLASNPEWKTQAREEVLEVCQVANYVNVIREKWDCLNNRLPERTKNLSDGGDVVVPRRRWAASGIPFADVRRGENGIAYVRGRLTLVTAEMWSFHGGDGRHRGFHLQT
ncbi:cytochrome P450 714B2-like [Henckelia pumila]|uniref:cytochrome P450 714B2-like n=1 Tax=Henckelia pumila TaxID=405737 RepID=UPI003C6E841A